MKAPRWLAIAILVGWVLQLGALWPLPSHKMAQLVANLSVSTSPLPQAALEELEASVWFSWVVWAVVVPIGIISGIMALGSRKGWVITFYLSAIAYLVMLCPWKFAIGIHSGAFQSMARFIDHASWTIQKPMLIFATVIFPSAIMAASVYIAVVLIKSHRRHAI